MNHHDIEYCEILSGEEPTYNRLFKSVTGIIEFLYAVPDIFFIRLGKQALPDSIAGLQKLEELDISSNLLVSLPGSIGLLLNLRVLNVSGNKLSSLPDSIARCR